MQSPQITLESKINFIFVELNLLFFVLIVYFFPWFISFIKKCYLRCSIYYYVVDTV